MIGYWSGRKWGMNCLDEIGSRGGEELDATIMQSNIEEEPEPNLEKVIDNIQVEPMCLLNL